MSQYILVMLWLASVFIVSEMVDVYTYENVLGKREKRVRWGFAVLAILPLLWWTAIRPHSFIDTGAYVKAFNAMPSALGDVGTYMESIDKDKGFSAFSLLIKILVGDNVNAYFFIIATIQLVIVATVFRKYSSNYIMALFLFVATTDYLSWMHNGVRQFMAVVLIFAATDLMLKKKYVPLIAVIIFASTMHGSALLMLPIIFVVQGKPWNRRTMIAILAFACAIIFVDKFTNLLDIMLVDTQYTNVVSDWQSWGDDGTNPIRVLVYSIPTILSLIGFRYIKVANNPAINLACNMGILSTMLYCLSAVTSGIFIGRLPIYCSMYATGILLPWELDNMFTKESARIMKLITIVAFVIFYYYQIHFTWGLI